MQSNDTRMLMWCAASTAVAGVVATVVGAVPAGGKGALGGAAGTLVVIAFMGAGTYAVQYAMRAFPELFQAVALVVYTTQVLLLGIVLVVFRDTTLFNLRIFAVAVLAGTLVWITAQIVTHVKSKTLYVEPDVKPVGKDDSAGPTS